jgi:hypothetical protein
MNTLGGRGVSVVGSAGGAFSLYTDWVQDGSKQWDTFLSAELPDWLAAVHQHQTRHVRHHRQRPQGLARHHFRWLLDSQKRGRPPTAARSRSARSSRSSTRGSNWHRLPTRGRQFGPTIDLTAATISNIGRQLQFAPTWSSPRTRTVPTPPWRPSPCPDRRAPDGSSSSGGSPEPSRCPGIGSRCRRCGPNTALGQAIWVDRPRRRCICSLACRRRSAGSPCDGRRSRRRRPSLAVAWRSPPGMTPSKTLRPRESRGMLRRTTPEGYAAGIELHTTTLAALKRGAPVEIEEEMYSHLGHFEGSSSTCCSAHLTARCRRSFSRALTSFRVRGR